MLHVCVARCRQACITVGAVAFTAYPVSVVNVSKASAARTVEEGGGGGAAQKFDTGALEQQPLPEVRAHKTTQNTGRFSGPENWPNSANLNYYAEPRHTMFSRLRNLAGYLLVDVFVEKLRACEVIRGFHGCNLVDMRVFSTFMSFLLKPQTLSLTSFPRLQSEDGTQSVGWHSDDENLFQGKVQDSLHSA